jgi:plastocyanin
VSREARSRVTLGIGIPLAAFVFLGILVFAFSRILLAVPETLAPWIALLFATNILVGCALAATIRGTRGFTFLIVVLVGTIVLGGVAGLYFGERPVHSLVEEAHGPPGQAGAGEGAPPGPGASPPATEQTPPPADGRPAAPPVTIAADNLQFSTNELELRSGGEAIIRFQNQEAQSHNVAIYTAPPAEGGTDIFRGEVVTGPTEVEYRFPAPDPGSYYFQCDVHPTMNGTVTVA